MSVGRKERRAHKRFAVPCHAVVTDPAGRELLRAQTANISDGGALLSAPRGELIPVGRSVRLVMRLPRSTENTYMLEEVSSPASVVRHDRAATGEALAVRFLRPLSLGLEV